MRCFAGLLTLCVAASSATSLWAGGSGLNLIVVVNQNSTNSVQLGNACCEQRGVLPQNVFRMTNWPPANGVAEWSRTQFQTNLLNPLLAMRASRGLTNQTDFVLLSMDIPYTVVEGGSYNSTTAALFYGFKTNDPPQDDTCSLPNASTNSYAFAELPFRLAPPNTAPTNSFLAMMLTHSNLPAAKRVLDQGVAGDSTFPTQKVYLAKTTDPLRNVRFLEFDNAILDTRIRGYNALVVTNNIPPTFYTNPLTLFTNSLGLLAGYDKLGLPTNAFVPGAMGDSLTSYGGVIFANSDGQTTLLAFLSAGAAASYGTVKEPCAILGKFPNPLNYFYQQRGFSIAESYYQSLRSPFEGLLVGEPLSAPFARPATASWNSLANGTVLSGQALLSPAFSTATTNPPLDQVDLFVDGTFAFTMTNLPPAQGNFLSVTLNGITVNYLVPANATVPSVTTALTDALNAQSGSTRVQAFATGDRLELQSLDLTKPAGNVTLSASAVIGSASRLTTQLTPARSTFLEVPATGRLTLSAYGPAAATSWLKLDFTKTNGTHVILSVTNTASSTNTSTLVTNLVNLLNATPALQGADGVQAADIVSPWYYNNTLSEFMLYARSPGWTASQIQVAFTASANLQVAPSGSNRLQENLYDLRPRNHLYVSSGLLSLPVSFSLNTAQFPDGYHQLTAVAYEGTSVRTQSRVSRTVRFQNTSLSATLTPQLSGTNATITMPLQFAVTANTPNISRIELFSTGGSIGVVSSQSSTIFTAPSAVLGLGLHPFYALVTDSFGNRYQTQTVWVRLVPPVLPFTLTISETPLKLSWPATVGLSYDVLATTNLATSFQTVASLLATTTTVQWPVPAPAGTSTFFRVRFTP